MKKLVVALVGIAAAIGSAAAQDSSTLQSITLFEGETFDKLLVAGDFDVEIRIGTPTGVRLEMPAHIPTVRITPKQERALASHTLIGGANQTENQEEPLDTLRYALRDGRLLLATTRPLFLSKNHSFAVQLPARFRAKAVVTVDDLKELNCTFPGEIRFTDKIQLQNVKVVCLNQTRVSGAALSATKTLSLSVFNSARFEGKISDTPEVELTVFNSGEADLSLAKAGNASAKVFNHGTLRLTGEVDRFSRNVFNGGVCEASGLDATRTNDSETEPKPLQQHITETAAGTTMIAGVGSKLGIGRYVAMAFEGGVSLREPGPNDGAIPEARDEHTILLEYGASILLQKGTYQVGAEEGRIVLRRVR